VQNPTKFELAISFKVAEPRLIVLPWVLARAYEVMQ
jgi:hypothetical protein